MLELIRPIKLLSKGKEKVKKITGLDSDLQQSEVYGSANHFALEILTFLFYSDYVERDGMDLKANGARGELSIDVSVKPYFASDRTGRQTLVVERYRNEKLLDTTKIVRLKNGHNHELASIEFKESGKKPIKDTLQTQEKINSVILSLRMPEKARLKLGNKSFSF